MTVDIDIPKMRVKKLMLQSNLNSHTDLCNKEAFHHQEGSLTVSFMHIAHMLPKWHNKISKAHQVRVY